MPQIHILDSETIDKIAAGEVVERPFSVVKELVENAIDAGASAVTVEARDGGIEFIRVTDNGCGMEQGQLRTAFLRHATSKIADASDLTRIRSLGFRGEALSSIAAVSRTEVVTKTPDSVTGNRILLEGVKEISFEEVGAPDGTTFLVRNLFFNTPARRKFLKQPATEGGYIADLMEHLALSRPDISFKFVLGGQVRFHTSGNGDLKEVIYRIYGRDAANALVPIQVEEDGVRIEGYLGKPEQVRSNRNFEIYFLNGRFIRSSVVSKAIEEGYKEYLMQHKFPLCVLHITMDTERVDVNVHPAKMDVRFSDAMRFSDFVTEAVRTCLQSREMIQETSLSSDRENREATRSERQENKGLFIPEPFEKRRTGQYRVMEDAKYKATGASKKDFIHDPVWSRVKSEKIAENPSKNDLAVSEDIGKQDDFFVETVEASAAAEDAGQAAAPEIPEPEVSAPEVSEPEVPAQIRGNGDRQLDLFEEKILTVENRRRFRVIGQVFETYWLIEFEDKMLMVDQHAAHEKVNYERLMRQFREKHVLSQSLMPPVIVSLSGQEEAVLKEHMEVFLGLGFEIEAFGGSEYALRGVPVDLYGCDERGMFLAVLDQLAEGGSFGGVRVIEEKIASMSCKAAVKGNNALSFAEAESLIDELLTLDNPYNCPHGRPTIIAMSRTEMDRKFKRIVS